jgi:hypothetical protein
MANYDDAYRVLLTFPAMAMGISEKLVNVGRTKPKARPRQESKYI